MQRRMEVAARFTGTSTFHGIHAYRDWTIFMWWYTLLWMSKSAFRFSSLAGAAHKFATHLNVYSLHIVLLISFVDFFFLLLFGWKAHSKSIMWSFNFHVWFCLGFCFGWINFEQIQSFCFWLYQFLNCCICVWYVWHFSFLFVCLL